LLKKIHKMGCLEGSGVSVLYIKRTVPKGSTFRFYIWGSRFLRNVGKGPTDTVQQLNNRISISLYEPSLFEFAYIQGVPLSTKPGSSLIIPKPMKILQRDLNSSTFVGEK
jgi:hypothetical protein